MYFLTEPVKINAPTSWVASNLGLSNKEYRRFARVAPSKIKTVISRHGSIDIFISRLLDRRRDGADGSTVSVPATMSKPLDDEDTMLCSKLCFLAPFALATTVSGGALGVVRSDPRWWTRSLACVEVACAVGVAKGAEVAPEPILAVFEGLPEGFQSSMQKDVAAGRPPELDAISGPILRGGEELGIDVHATRFFVERIALPE